jgi:flavorubredoxin
MVQQATRIQPPVELVPNKLYGLGGLAPIESGFSWLPKGVTGYEPVNAFLLLEDDGALLVDTGVPAHKEIVKAQLEELIGSERELQVFLTRFEPDCLANLPTLTANFNFHTINGGGVLNPFDFFDDISSAEQVKSDYSLELNRKKPGDVVAVNGTRQLELVVTTIRLLTTFWAYDATTKTLFTSDSFGHVQIQDPSRPAVLDAADDTTTIDQVRAHLLTKFDWLLGAETEPLIADLQKIFSTYDVEILAPTHGAAIRGKETVARHVEMFIQVLSEIKN